MRIDKVKTFKKWRSVKLFPFVNLSWQIIIRAQSQTLFCSTFSSCQSQFVLTSDWRQELCTAGMSPRILSSRMRIFCNPVSGTGAPQPSMAMEGRRRTGGGQKQSRHRGCVVGGQNRKKEPARQSPAQSPKKYVSVGSEEGTDAPRPLQPAAPCCVQMHGEFSPASLRRQMICLNMTGNQERESKRGREKEGERGSCRQHYEKATHQWGCSWPLMRNVFQCSTQVNNMHF